MKKYFLFLVAAVVAMTSLAAPADRRPRTLAQPDGDSITVRLLGDEYYNYYTTTDGYTLIRESDGAFRYATLQNGRLVATSQLAHNPGRRQVAEKSLLATLDRNLLDRDKVSQSKQLRAQRDKRNSQRNSTRKKLPSEFDNFRGLVILINFSDVHFDVSGPHDFYDHMCNDDNYTGFNYSNGYQTKFYSCPGSLREYYRDNSMGQFDPPFDVYGPVTVSLKATDVKKHDNAGAVFIEAINKLDSQIDFSRYDCDNDGLVDMMYFIVAGFASNYSGNNSNYLWPHQSILFNFDQHQYYMYDNVRLFSYACSTEKYGWEGYHDQPLGIGTMCHEFSHVLGLPDLYDTDYATQGQSNHPGGWDVMAGGDYQEGRCPCGYTIFERAALGFAQPETIEEPGTYQLRAVNTFNEGYVLLSPSEDVTFLLDNRQNSKWDKYLPGHGMIIARVDFTDESAWAYNEVNADASHNYYELIRAGGMYEGGGGGAASSDPFPGTSGVTDITNFTNPNLTTWDGQLNDFEIHGIAEHNGVITFNVSNAEGISSIVEDFETLPVTTVARTTNQLGRWAMWNFTNCNVMAPAEGRRDDAQSVGMYAPSQFLMVTDVEADIYRVTAHVMNLDSSIDASFKLTYSTDQGATWEEADNALQDVDGGADVTLAWRVAVKEPVRFRLAMTSGSRNKSQRAYVDNFTIHYTGELRKKYESIYGDVNGDGVVTAVDVSCIVNVLAGLESADVYQGRANVNGDSAGVTAADIAAVINILAGL